MKNKIINFQIFLVIGSLTLIPVSLVAQVAFNASGANGGALLPGNSTTCTAGTAGAIRNNAGALEACTGSSWVALGGGGTPDRIVSASANIVAGNGGTISFSTGGVSGTAFLDTVGRLVTPGISTTTNRASFTTIYASGNVGIGATSPAAELEVSGTISATRIITTGDPFTVATETIFTADGTWTKPASGSNLLIVGCGGGGGGGAGRGNATATNRGGGGGGAAGNTGVLLMQLWQAPSSVSVTIGAGGAGGVAANGIAGGTTQFGSLLSISNGDGGSRALVSEPGSGGGNGSSGGGGGSPPVTGGFVYAGTTGRYVFLNGFQVSVPGAAAVTVTSVNQPGAAGGTLGGSGGLAGATAPIAPTPGASPLRAPTGGGGGGGGNGNAASAGGAGGAGQGWAGAGGNGGAGVSSGNGVNGSNATAPCGGGGGGGGGSVSGGSGGNGARGELRVYVW